MPEKTETPVAVDTEKKRKPDDPLMVALTKMF